LTKTTWIRSSVWRSTLPVLLVLSTFVDHPIHAEESTGSIERLLESLVVQQRETYGLIGLGAIAVQNGNFIGPYVSGERKKASQVLITKDDRWHTGSVTKPITATMIARLVEQGTLSWNSTINEIFPESEEIHSDWHDVSLTQLLTHTSGAVPNFSFLQRLKNPPEGTARKKARELAVLDILKTKPKNPAGSDLIYSNVGYTIAGVMAEKVTGQVWEDLVKREVFDPLNINSGGFGPPQDRVEKLEQPRGHRKLFGFTFAAGHQEDNTPIMGPAGSVHLSLRDLAIFANEHLQGELGNGSFLKADTFKLLHTPVLQRYAYGWVVSSRKHLGVGPVIWHNGSNTMWYALLVFMPDINAVVAVTTNDGSIEKSKESAWAIVNQLAPLLLEQKQDIH